MAAGVDVRVADGRAEASPRECQNPEFRRLVLST
jgi:hypothetical protein